jgi:cell division septal protein FtsQ
VSDLKSRWAQDAWTRLLESRRRRDRRRKIALLAFGAAVLAALALAIGHRASIVHAPPFTVREILLTGNRLVDGAEVLDLLGVRAGDPWWRYSPSAIRARVLAHPRVANLTVRYEWFHRLRVEVREREASLFVLGSSQGDLTRDGWFLPAAPAVGEEIDRPVLRPIPGTLPAPGHQVDARTQAVARLIGRIEEERPDLWREISEIEMTQSEARAILRSRLGVILFEPGRNDELWARVPEVLADLARRGRDDVVLDLTFAGKIVVRLPDSAPPDTVSALPRREEA